MARNIGADFNRFKIPHKGGHYANSTAGNNGFCNKNSVVSKPLNQEDFIPEGRPLWQREVQKDIPSPTKYRLKRAFDDAMLIKNPVSCIFGASYGDTKKVLKLYFLPLFFF